MTVIFRKPVLPQQTLGAALHRRLRSPTLVWSGGDWTRSRVVNEPAVEANYPSWGMSKYGRVLALTSAGSQQGLRISLNSNLIFPNSSFATIALVTRHRDTTARQSVAFGYDGAPGGASRVLAHMPWEDGNVYFDYGDAANGRAAAAWGAKTTNWTAVVFVASSGTGRGREIWRNGELLVRATASNGTRPSDTSSFFLGYPGGYANLDDAQEYALCVVSSVDWSPAEITAWCADPFGSTFAPRQIIIPTAAAAGGVPTLSASTYVAGSLTSTGWRPQVTAS